MSIAPEIRQDWARLVKLVAGCAFFVAIFASNYQPATRSLTIFALAAIVAIAAAYELTMRQARPIWIIIFAGLIFAAAGIVCFVLNRYAPLIEARGPLLADKHFASPSRCEAPPGNKLTMIFGPDRVVGEGNGPFTPIRIGTCLALTIERNASGLVVNAFGFDADDNLVWRVHDNDFRQVIRGFLTEHRPDASTLRVTDNEGKETLYVRYLNPTTVQIRGTFTCAETPPVTITDASITIGGQPEEGHRCASMASFAAPVIVYAKP